MSRIIRQKYAEPTQVRTVMIPTYTVHYTTQLLSKPSPYLFT